MNRFCSLFLFSSLLLAEPADWIWSARYVITQDAQRRVIENGAVAIRGDRIVGVGTKAEINARFQARQRPTRIWRTAPNSGVFLRERSCCTKQDNCNNRRVAR